MQARIVFHDDSSS